MIGFAVPHFVDDFLYGVPDEFGLTNPQAQVLGGLMFAVLIVVFSLSARGHRIGYSGAAFFGLFLMAAAAAKHLDRMLMPGPYWGGLISEVSIIGLIVSGLALAVVSLMALRRSRREHP
jgi:hypothetical protein